MEQRPEATGEGLQTPFPSETDEDSLLREQKWGGGVQLMWGVPGVGITVFRPQSPCPHTVAEQEHKESPHPEA